MEKYEYCSSRRTIVLIILSTCIHTIILLLLFIVIYPPLLNHPPLINPSVDESSCPNNNHKRPTITFYDQPDATTPSTTTSIESSEMLPSTPLPISLSNPSPQEHVPTSMPSPALTVLDIQQPANPSHEPETTSLAQEQPLETALSLHNARKKEDVTSRIPDTYPQPILSHRKPPHDMQVAAAQLRNITRNCMRQKTESYADSVPAHVDTMYQLAYQLYGNKIWQQLERSFNAQRKYIHLAQNASSHAIVVITLDSSGKLIAFHVEYPHKNYELKIVEQVLFEGAKKAGLFNPIPQQLKTNTITLRFPLTIYAEHGFYTYVLNHGGVNSPIPSH